jgi:hypothetical protein
MAADMEEADRVLGSALGEADTLAGKLQNRFRFSELAIIYGGVAAVALGLASGLSEQGAFSFVEAVLTAGLGALAFISGQLRWQRRWLRRRWQAETLRGERFLFLARVGEYAEADDPARRLRQRVVDIERMAREVQQDD